MNMQRFFSALLHSRATIGASVVGLAMLLGCVTETAGAQTLDRIKESGHMRLGYIADAKPFNPMAKAI